VPADGHAQSGTARAARIDGDGAVVTLDDVARDGEAEPRSAALARASVVDAGEPFEDALVFVGGDARAVVGDREDG
jgi:hypothetical protein